MSNKVKKTEAVTPVNTQAIVPRNKVEIDGTFNARDHIDPEGESIQALAQDIKLAGLIHPVLVRQPDDDGNYFLVAGFRRMAAIALLGWKQVPVTILGSGEEQDAFLGNLAENVNRQDLTGHELAMAVKHIRDSYDMKPDLIALRLSGVAKSYITNMLRTVDNVMAEILEQWGHGHKAATTDCLNRLAKLYDKDTQQHKEDEQYKAWAAECRARKLVPGFGDGLEDPEGDTPDEPVDNPERAARSGEGVTTKPNAGMMQLLVEELIAAVKDGKVNKSAGEAAILIAQFALGQESAVIMGKFEFNPVAMKEAAKASAAQEKAIKAAMKAEEMVKKAREKAKQAKAAAAELVDKAAAKP